MNFEVKRKTFKVTLYGETFDVKAPSLRQMDEHNESISGLASKEIVKKTVAFLAELGIPEEKTREMDYDDFLPLVEFIQSAKKK